MSSFVTALCNQPRTSLTTSRVTCLYTVSQKKFKMVNDFLGQCSYFSEQIIMVLAFENNLSLETNVPCAARITLQISDSDGKLYKYCTTHTVFCPVIYDDHFRKFR